MAVNENKAVTLEQLIENVATNGTLKYRQGKPLSREEKMLAYNVYLSHLNKGSNKSQSINTTSIEIGLSMRTIWNIVKEKETTGILLSPTHKRTRASFLDKLNEEQKNILRAIVNDFVSRNETPSLNKIMPIVMENKILPTMKRTTLWQVLKKLELADKINWDDSQQVDSQNVLYGVVASLKVASTNAKIEEVFLKEEIKQDIGPNFDSLTEAANMEITEPIVQNLNPIYDEITTNARTEDKRNLQQSQNVLDGVVSNLNIASTSANIEEIFLKEQIKQEVEDPFFDPLIGASNIEVTEPIEPNLIPIFEEVQEVLHDEITTNRTRAKRKRPMEKTKLTRNKIKPSKKTLKSRKVDALERIANSLEMICDIMRSRSNV